MNVRNDRRAESAAEQLMNAANVLILLVIALIYVATGTRIGEDAMAALSEGAVYRGAPNGAVALECVVNWNAESLPDMLDTLKEEDVQITFFVSGRWARSHAALLTRMCEDGHEIGTNGFSPLLDGDLSVITQDVMASNGVIRQITGSAPRLYYPGFRKREVSVRAAERLGMTAVAASVDLQCARYDAEKIAARVSEHAFDGSILTIQPTAEGAAALKLVLDGIRRMGCEPATVGDVLEGVRTVW